MIAIIHGTWDSDIVLEEGDLEKISRGEEIFGEIADNNKIGRCSLLKWNNESSGYYFSLNWNRNEPDKYHFEINNQGMEILIKNNYVHGRYENGCNGSKLSIYGLGEDGFTKENIEFAIQMIKLDSKSK